MEEVFRALGDPTRLRILGMLAEDGEMCVCVIVGAMDMGQPAVSHHMSVLKRAGLVNARRQGQWIYYSLNTQAIETGPTAFLRQMVDRARRDESEKLDSGCCANEKS